MVSFNSLWLFGISLLQFFVSSKWFCVSLWPRGFLWGRFASLGIHVSPLCGYLKVFAALWLSHISLLTFLISSCLHLFMVAGHLCAVVLHLLVYMKCLFWGHFAFPGSHFCIYSDSFSISLDNSAVGCTSLVVFVSLGGSLASGFGVLHLSKVDFVSLCGSFSGVLVDRFLWFTLGCEPEKTSSAVLVQEKEKGWKKKIVLEWFLTWPCLCCVADDEMTWKMSAGQKKDRDMEERREEDRRRTRQRQETEREKQRQ